MLLRRQCVTCSNCFPATFTSIDSGKSVNVVSALSDKRNSDILKYSLESESLTDS